MNHRIAAGLRRLAGSTAAVGVLLVFCLNLAILPCAMALGLDDHDCPHCPPADEHSMAGHPGHEKVRESELAGPDCDTASSTCCDATASNIDTRTSHQKLKHPGGDQPMAGPVSQVDVPATVYALAAFTDPPDPPGTSVPRHILFCVYLD